MVYDMIWYIWYDKSDMINDMIWYDMVYDMTWRLIGNCNWVDTRWQYYSTHLHTKNTEQHIETEYTEQNIYKNKNTQFTKLNRIIQNIQSYIQLYKIELKEYEESSRFKWSVYLLIMIDTLLLWHFGAKRE